MTSFDPLSLLGASAMGGAAGAGQAARPHPGVTPFAELLGMSGPTASSGVPFSVAPGVDLTLSDQQRQDMSRVIDLAAKAGVVTLLVQDGDRSMVVDVQNRVVTRVCGADEVVTGVDGAVRLPSHDQLPIADAPSSSLGASLLRALSGKAQ